MGLVIGLDLEQISLVLKELKGVKVLKELRVLRVVDSL